MCESWMSSSMHGYYSKAANANFSTVGNREKFEFKSRYFNIYDTLV